MYVGKKVRVIEVVIFYNGRKIKTEYIGIMIREEEYNLIIRELDDKIVSIPKKYTKRVEEI